MHPEKISRLIKELEFKATRSSGPGGQNVNKVSTKVELRFRVEDSMVLSENQKVKIAKKLQNYITTEGELIMTDQTSRSQLSNKESVTQRFIDLIQQALKPIKPRVPTKPTLASQKKRVDDKKKLAQKKDSRRWEP